MAQNLARAKQQNTKGTTNSHTTSQEPRQPKVLGVLGERASMTKTLNYGALAREQMSGIEQMERQIQDNLKKYDVKGGMPINGFK